MFVACLTAPFRPPRSLITTGLSDPTAPGSLSLCVELQDQIVQEIGCCLPAQNVKQPIAHTSILWAAGSSDRFVPRDRFIVRKETT
jgi:hypothetical protein